MKSNKKTWFLGQKVQKSLEKSLEIRKKFGKSSEKFGKVWQFRKFGNSKFSKNYEKTCSDSKTDSKVRLKVWNAGP